MIKLRVNHADLCIISTETITSGSHDAFYTQFDFDDSWNGLTKVAQFRSGNVVKSCILPQSHICAIPWEVLTTPKTQLEIGVCGMDGNSVVLPTIWVNAGLICEGAVGGEESLPPTPSIYEQMLSIIGNLDELYTGDKSNLVAAINEVYAMKIQPLDT